MNYDKILKLAATVCKQRRNWMVLKKGLSKAAPGF
jgi:hypothetical protein